MKFIPINWYKGRQKSGYDVMTIFSFKLPFKLSGMDCHLLRYNETNFIPPHKDEVKDKNHHRINIILKKPKEGGKFFCEGHKSFLWGRITYFRPDIMEHSVSECHSERLIFSLGWVVNSSRSDK